MMGIRMRLHDGEPLGLALRRFKKLVARTGLARDLREHQTYAEPSLLRRTKKFQKRLKARRATLAEERELAPAVDPAPADPVHLAREEPRDHDRQDGGSEKRRATKNGRTGILPRFSALTGHRGRG